MKTICRSSPVLASVSTRLLQVELFAPFIPAVAVRLIVFVLERRQICLSCVVKSKLVANAHRSSCWRRCTSVFKGFPVDTTWIRSFYRQISPMVYVEWFVDRHGYWACTCDFKTQMCTNCRRTKAFDFCHRVKPLFALWSLENVCVVSPLADQLRAQLLTIAAVTIFCRAVL